MKSPRRFIPSRVAAFTLVEVLVSTAIIALIMIVLVQIVDQTNRTWRYTTEKIEKFQEARDGFESMTRKLSQATLNTYWEYLGIISGGSSDLKPRSKNVNSTDYQNFIPQMYGRMSELRFICGPMTGAKSIVVGGSTNSPFHGIFFQAPFGEVDGTDPEERSLNNLLNTWGYFLEVGDDDNRPTFISTQVAPKRWRSRLMEFSQPALNMALNDTPYIDTTTNWFSSALKVSNAPKRMLAENVVALIFLPKLSKQDEDYRVLNTKKPIYLSPNYSYDSTLTLNDGNTASGANDLGGVNPKNQLPPLVQVTMVAIDERSAARFMDTHPGQPLIIGPSQGSLFTANSDKMENPKTASDAGGDLARYEQALIDMRLTYRIFSTNVSIRGAKWSRAQTK